MKEEIAKEWVKALRSKKYKQGKGKLCSIRGKNVKYCCLGVLCHILNTPYTKKYNKKWYGNEEYVLNSHIRDEVEMQTSTGVFKEDNKSKSLVELNDDGKTFKEIADVIENHWQQL